MEEKINISKKPTIEEFCAYIQSHGFNINPYELYKEFEHRNWTTKKGAPMKSWTALVDSRNGIICQRDREIKLRNLKNARLFRLHRGSLADSMNTCREVASLKDIAAYVRSDMNWLPECYVNFQIDPKGVDDSRRLGESWADTHYVLVDCTFPAQEFKAQCIGMCNFYEEGIVE